MNELLNQLSPAQCECLRLVAKGRRSKEIAIITGFAPATVDIYVSKAARMLGVKSRREAALLLLRWERQTDINLIFPISRPGAPVDYRNSAVDIAASEAGETGDGFHVRVSDLVSLPPIGGRENDLSHAGRLKAAWKVALFSAMALVAGALIFRIGIRALS